MLQSNLCHYYTFVNMGLSPSFRWRAKSLPARSGPIRPCMGRNGSYFLFASRPKPRPKKEIVVTPIVHQKKTGSDSGSGESLVVCSFPFL